MPDFLCVNFYGHDQTDLSGLKFDAKGWKGTVIYRNWRRRHHFKAVGITETGANYFNYNATLGPKAADRAKEISSEVMLRSPYKNPVILVTGYSIGGVTAVYFGQAINKRSDCTLGYIGLSDAAFYKPESDGLMLNPNVTAKYRKNYYQTKGNDPSTAEIHGPVTGFENFDLNDRMTGNDDAEWHDQANIIGNGKMAEDVRWCLAFYK